MATIIVLEDTQIILTLIGIALKHHTLHMSPSWQQLVRPASADLALLDLQLPGIDGFAIKPLLDPIPCVVISSYHDAIMIQRARALGFLGFLGKPFTIHTLNEYVDAFLRGESIWQPIGKNPYHHQSQRKK